VAIADPGGGFHSVQRHVQQHGADHASLGSSLLRRAEPSLLDHTSLEPERNLLASRERAEVAQEQGVPACPGSGSLPEGHQVSRPVHRMHEVQEEPRRDGPRQGLPEQVGHVRREGARAKARDTLPPLAEMVQEGDTGRLGPEISRVRQRPFGLVAGVQEAGEDAGLQAVCPLCLLL